MRESSESSKDFSQAVKCLYDYYRWRSITPMVYTNLNILNRYDPKTSRYLHFFLMENNLIKIEGNNVSVIDTLPSQLLLLNLCTNFFTRHPDYIFIPSICDILPNSPSQQLAAGINNSYPNFFQGRVTLPPFDLSREPVPSIVIPQFSSVFSPEHTPPRPKMTLPKFHEIRMNTWPVEDFINSLRLVHNYYHTNSPSNYKVQTLWDIASLNKFTSGNSLTSRCRIVKTFNQFLITYGFISQKNLLLISISVNKELPSDARLRDLFKQFRELSSLEKEHLSSLSFSSPPLLSS